MTASDRRLVEVREEQGTVWLILDSGETFELAPQSVPNSLPAAGGSISSPLLAEIRVAAERKQVARRIFAMLDRRLQPTYRIHTRLVADGFSAEAVEAVLDQMSAQGVYSDGQYARAWCRDCLGGRDVGRRYLVNKLREKRIPAAVAQAAADEALDSAEEAERAERAAAKRWQRIRGPLDHRAVGKIVRFLLGRGFAAGLAHRVARATKPTGSDDETSGYR